MMADPSAAPFLTSPDFNKLQMSTTSLNDWLESTDFSGFLSQEVFSQAPESPENLFYTPSPEVLCTSDSAYSSDCSEQHSPFDQLYSDASHSGINSPIDETLFEPYNFTDPLLVPEIEKILAGNPYELEIPTSIVIDPVNTSSSKKRIREEPVVENSVTLSRDQLLVMTSKEIESYVEDLKSKRTLTASEEKDLKRQRRLVKNREYASQSRSRKKLAVEDLEKQLEVAKAEADQYKKHNQALVEENRVLKRQLGSIADTIKKVQQNGGSSTNLSSSAGSVGVFDKFVKIGAGRPANAPTKGVSACLLAIFFMVFTFAAFWDNESNFSKENIVLHRQRALSSLDSDSSVWEAASGLLRESWQTSSSYLPTWESAYQLFITTYPFYPSSSPSSSSSSSSTTGIDMSVIRPVTEKIVPLKTTTTTPPVPHLPPSSLPSTNKTCNHTGH